MARKIIPDSIREVLRYDPEAGLLVWLVDRTRGVKAGDIAGCKHANGYITVGYMGRHYLAHRVCWFLAHNEQPKEIDHINRDKHDNRLSNLRNVTKSVNCLNRKDSRVNWYFRKDSRTWQIRASAGGKKVYSGRHHTLAWCAIILAERESHPIGLPSP